MAQRKFFRKTFQKNKSWKKLAGVFKFLILGMLFFLLGGSLLFVYYAKDLPRPERFGQRKLIQPTRIYDRTGNVLLYELFAEHRRIPVPLEKVPEHLKQAVVATEDANFWRHPGIDIRAIARAFWVNLRAGRVVQGASTITQQLIRSTFLTLERTPERKIREIILSLELERRYSKEQILEWYLNQVPFGPNLYGVEAASRSLFNKPVSEISVPEAAVLAALIRAPSRLSPFGPNLDQLLARKDHVLRRMSEVGYLSPEQAEKYKQEKIEFARPVFPIKAPHFVMEVKQELISKYNEDYLRTAGFKIYTTLDWDLQQAAQEAIKKGAERNKRFRAFNAGLAAIDPHTGQILAMVGSKNWFGAPYPKECLPGRNCLFEPYPNVTLLPRQPGSAFKPFVYAAVFKQEEYNDQTIVLDEETNFGVWGGQEFIPRNFDGRFRGEVSLREALAQSLNIPSVKAFIDLAGKENAIRLTRNLGITTPLPAVPSLVLGGGEVKLLEMVSAYGVFAAEGLKVEPFKILKIKDARGRIVEETKRTPRRVLEIETARLINDVLADNEARAPIMGSRSPLYFGGLPISAKTGTTDDFRDAWTVGYSPSLAVGVWVGNNDNSPMRRGLGLTLAAPIFRDFMNSFLERTEEKIE